MDSSRSYVAEAFSPTAATRAYCGAADADAIEARITALLSALTPAEKVDLMHGHTLGLVEHTWEVPGNEAHRIPGLH